MSADVLAFPREGFIINPEMCRKPGADRQTICLRKAGHDGEHRWSDWRGCKARAQMPDGRWVVIPFGGFAG